MRTFECQDCKFQWEEIPCTQGGKHGHEINCPKCKSMDKMKIVNGERQTCGKNKKLHESHGSGGCSCH